MTLKNTPSFKNKPGSPPRLDLTKNKDTEQSSTLTATRSRLETEISSSSPISINVVRKSSQFTPGGLKD